MATIQQPSDSFSQFTSPSSQPTSAYNSQTTTSPGPYSKFPEMAALTQQAWADFVEEEFHELKTATAAESEKLADPSAMIAPTNEISAHSTATQPEEPLQEPSDQTAAEISSCYQHDPYSTTAALETPQNQGCEYIPLQRGDDLEEEHDVKSSYASSTSSELKERVVMPLYATVHPMLWGTSLEFIPYPTLDIATGTLLPFHELLRHHPQQYPPTHFPTKMFFGHVWSNINAGCFSWLMMVLTRCADRIPPHLCAPEYHFHPVNGCFKGCLHAYLYSSDPEYIAYCLHRRVLFDKNGIWYAGTQEAMQLLNAYTHRLRKMPTNLRHEQLQGLPPNPLTCEVAVTQS